MTAQKHSLRSRPLHTRYTPDPDKIMEQMIEWGRMGRTMPQSFRAGGVTYPFGSTEGEFGRMLPGRGFMPATPLKQLGIDRHHPYVYDPNLIQRTRDRFLRAGLDLFTSELGAITTYDQVFAARGAGKGQDTAVMKTSMTTTANIWYSLFQQAGAPGAGTYLATTPPTDRLPVLTTAGALSFFMSNPAGTDRKYLLTFGFTAVQQVNMVILVDVVNDGGIFRLSVNTAETVTTPTLATRQYGPGTGIGHLLTFICQTAGTPGAGTFTAQYVDQAGANTNAPALNTAASAILVGVLFPASVGVSSGAGSFFVPLAAASTGVQAVKQTTCSVAGTGNVASNVFFPLLFLPGVAANAYIERDSTTQVDGITELVNASGVIGCLALYCLPNTTSTGALTAYMKTVSG